MSNLLTLREAADLAGTSPAYLRVVIRRGLLPATKRIERGQIVNYVTEDDLRAYVAQRRTRHDERLAG